MSKFTTNTSLNVARLLYLLVCIMAGMALAYHLSGSDKTWIGMLAGLFIASFFILVEFLTKNYTIRGFSTGTFGLLIGLFCGWLLTKLGIPELLSAAFSEVIYDKEILSLTFNSIIYSSFGFLGTVIALRSSQNDFAVIIPYVRFRQDNPTGRPLLLDSEAISDGRIPEIMNSGFLEKFIVIPKFILDELEVLANSPSPGRRQRGEKGLSCLEKLQKNPEIKVTVHESKSESNDDSHNTQLLQISQLLNAQILTTDENLTKVARLQGIRILNLNDLSEALKPQVDIGSKIQISLVRTGKEEHQGVGYLSDGSMIVVNHAVAKIGSTVTARVISTISTSAGMMVFADMED